MGLTGFFEFSDGITLRYDSLSYSKGSGRTGYHYGDGLPESFFEEAHGKFYVHGAGTFGASRWEVK